MITGYTRRLLKVDLSYGLIVEELLNIDYALGFIRGSGLASRYIRDIVTNETDLIS